MSQSQKIKLHIARALIANPNVMVISHALEGLHLQAGLEMLDILCQHVRERGVCQTAGVLHHWYFVLGRDGRVPGQHMPTSKKVSRG